MQRVIHPIVALALIVTGHSAAAETAAQIRHARFLAVGDLPPFRQVIRDGVRYELEPPPGSIPPREILAGFVGNPSEPVPLRLGRIGPHVTVPAGAGPLHLWRDKDTEGASPWVTLKSPEAGDFLVLLWRSPSAETWNEASAMTIAETPRGMARVVNLFPSALSIEWGDEALRLPAGRSFTRRLPQQDEPVALRILSQDAQGGARRYYSGAISANQNERCLVTIYRADGVVPRRPLKVSILREPAITPTPQQPSD